jgi:hypothetical protein
MDVRSISDLELVQAEVRKAIDSCGAVQCSIELIDAIATPRDEVEQKGWRLLKASLQNVRTLMGLITEGPRVVPDSAEDAQTVFSGPRLVQ